MHSLGNYWRAGKEIFESFFPFRHDRIFHYNDVYIYYMVYLAESARLDAFKNTRYIRAIETLQKYDAEHDGNLVEILYCYLLSERRATAAGNLLHMLRNNVLYISAHHRNHARGSRRLLGPAEADDRLPLHGAQRGQRNL
jgi:hypothetical protein